MKKGKPIEPGCLALVINARNMKENIGRTVRVLHLIPDGWIPPQSPVGKPLRVVSPRVWVVETLPGHPPLKGCTLRESTQEISQIYDALQMAFAERHLIRLDDDEEPKQETRVTETHKPKTEEVF